MKKNTVDISVVVPMFNESDNLAEFSRRVVDVLKSMKVSYEIICVNDGSSDDTLKKLTQTHQKNKCFKVVDLSRNFGKELALTAGIDLASGNTVVPIDADLQDPPELIPELYRKWQEGFEVVYAKREKRKGESFFKLVTASLFYKIIRLLTRFNIPENTGDFRLMDRKVVDALKEIREYHRFMKGLFSWVGFRQACVLYDRDPRFSGKTKWNHRKLYNLAIEAITSFSHFPLRLASYSGFIISMFAFIYAFIVILKKLLFGDPVQGYASMVTIILFLGGIQLMTIGIIGEYVGRIYNETKRRPLYFIRESYGIDPKKIKE